MINGNWATHIILAPWLDLIQCWPRFEPNSKSTSLKTVEFLALFFPLQPTVLVGLAMPRKRIIKQLTYLFQLVFSFLRS